MGFNGKQVEFLKENINRIRTMNKIELDTFLSKLYRSKNDMAKEVFNKILEATDIRVLELNSKVSPMAVYATIEYED